MSPTPALTDAQISRIALGFVLIAQRQETRPSAIAFSATRTAGKALPPETANPVQQAIAEITDAMAKAWEASGQSRKHEWDAM